MQIIQQDLNNQISKNPENDYSVLITLKDETLPQVLKGKGKFIMGNKIFSAKLRGEEIKDLVNHSQIEAIEPDIPMSIL